ncbi:hypothetical protein LLH06_00025 [Mucilaginibacter daejeonensis]|uniref:hypothetical protein n=1 Tax=Mucilaginibacter daejeonensis TaxID=398049 RepID=UPI001D174B70|nr:hypothetical protein [Mucilaginibacter daejeonensis]UEG53368.1 hypothetical protein LLH06_00025 [Mucilaginibacter daejeonensis]
MFYIHNSDPSVRNLPIMLSPERVIDPYTVLDSFFYPGRSLPFIRRDLMMWLVAAISGKKKWKRDKIVDCLYSFMTYHTLLDALWLIYERKYKMTTKQIAKRGQPVSLAIKWSQKALYHLSHWKELNEMDLFPEFLEPNEELTPFEIIHKFFADQDLFDARQKMSHWTFSAIACQYEYQPMKRDDLVVFHRLFLRAVEAAFIIVELRIANKIIEDYPVKGPK